MSQTPRSKDAVAHQFPSRWRRPHPAGPSEAHRGHWSWSSATWLWRRGRARQQTLGWQERGAQPDRGTCDRNRRYEGGEGQESKSRRGKNTLVLHNMFRLQFRRVEHFVVLLNYTRQFVVIVLVLMFPVNTGQKLCKKLCFLPHPYIIISG